MDQLQRVVWQEGLFLTPQHLQQSDRHHEAQTRLASHPWPALDHGLLTIVWDEPALLRGEATVQKIIAVLPDGTVISAPSHDPLPPTRSFLDAMTASHDGSIGVYLALPVARDGAPLAAEGGMTDGRPTRLRHRHTTVTDDASGHGSRELLVAEKNVRLLLHGEPTDGYTALPIARFARDANGDIGPHEKYVPPVLHAAASPLLVSALRSVLEVCSQRAEDQASQRRERISGVAEFSAAEAGSFWLTSVLFSAMPILRHLVDHPRLHPERIYTELASLAGRLYTFSTSGSPRDLPAYDHNALGPTFIALRDTVLKLLDTIIPTRCITLPITQEDAGIFTARLTDDVVAGATVFLAVRTDAPPDRIARDIPVKAKLTSRDRLEMLIRQALRGLELSHRAAPPAEVPVQAGRVYFELGRVGPHWDAIAASRMLAIYVPPEYRDVRLELMAVKD